MTDTPQIDHGEIARQNDEFRRSYGLSRRIPGRIMMTPGIADFDAITMQRIQSEIVLFDNFSADNDPYAEHDFGAFTIKVDGEDTVIWFKIDLYDRQYAAGSEKPDNPAQTRRVMTILLPSEY